MSKPTRIIRVACPSCDFIETQTVEVSKQAIKPPPAEETISCTCDRCYSDRLDKIYPGARERMNKRLAREKALSK